MKSSFIALGFVFGSLIVNAVELPQSLQCQVVQYNLGQNIDKMDPLAVTDIPVSQNDLKSGHEFIVQNYEGKNISLSFQMPDEKSGEEFVSISLSERSSNSSLALASTHLAKDVADFSYRQMGSTKYLHVLCATTESLALKALDRRLEDK